MAMSSAKALQPAATRSRTISASFIPHLLVPCSAAARVRPRNFDVVALRRRSSAMCFARAGIGGGGTGSGFVPPSRQVVPVGQSIVEPHLDGRLAVVADGEPGPVADYVHRRMLGR